MARPTRVGMAQTVQGPTPANALGVAMMHEHLLCDLRGIFAEPEDPAERVIAHQPIRLEILSYAVMNWRKCRDNLVLDDVELATREAMLFKAAGGGTIVDVTTSEFGRDPAALKRIATATGLHIIMGCGNYHAFFHRPEMSVMSEQALADEMIRDIDEGVSPDAIRAGIIGEVGCSWPMHPDEAKSLRASALAQAATGAAITIHPGRHVDSPFEILDILERAGADLERVVMGHMERTGLDRTGLLALARRGCVLEWDWFGEVRPTYPDGRVDVPSDGERIKEIAFLIDRGFGRSIVLSQDVCFKTRLAAYGGPGYAHIARYVRGWMKALGLAEPNIRMMLEETPRRLLAFA